MIELQAVTRDDRDAEQTERAMAEVERFVETLEDRLPAATAERLDNALLNVAVHRILALEGASQTAAILWRLADVLASGTQFAPGHPVDLNRFDG